MNIQKSAEGVIHFWFEEIDPKMQFKKDPEFDVLIRSRFLGAYEAIVEDHSPWLESPQTALAAVIVLDQFSRNMFRDEAKAFTADPIASKIARFLVENGWFEKLEQSQRNFVFMPFMHSEDPEVHAWALPFFEAHCGEGTLGYELKHKAIIDQFGRYPHRNALLGRESTAEELEFLKENSGF